MGGDDIADDGVRSSKGVGAVAKVNIRILNGPTLILRVNLNSTVKDFRPVVTQKCAIHAEQQLLIYKGRVMKDDQTLKSFGLEDGANVDLVRCRATDAGIRNANSTSTDFGRLSETGQRQEELVQNLDNLDMSALENLVNNLENLVNLVQNLYMNNSRMRAICDRNSVLRRILNDPATPQIMSHIESSSEGFNMFRRRLANVQADFAALLGAQAGTTENTTSSPALPNANPLPNPSDSAAGRSQTNSGAWVNPIDSDMDDSPGGLGFHSIDQMLSLPPDAFLQLLRSSSISQMMRNTISNPQYMNQNSFNSQLQSMLDSNPHFRDMLQISEVIRQVSPETMQQFLNFHRAVAPQTSREAAQNDGGTTGAAGNMGLDMLNSASRPQERYATELSQLREMGFFDIQENIRALIATAGNVRAAVRRLLGNPSQ